MRRGKRAGHLVNADAYVRRKDLPIDSTAITFSTFSSITATVYSVGKSG